MYLTDIHTYVSQKTCVRNQLKSGNHPEFHQLKNEKISVMYLYNGILNSNEDEQNTSKHNNITSRHNNFLTNITTWMNFKI